MLLGTATAFAQNTPAVAEPSAGDEKLVLSEFVVTASKGNSYGATTAFTATRIGVPIIQTPLNIQVVTAELINDQAAYNLQNALRYTSGVSGDSTNFEAGSLFLPNSTSSTIRGFVPNVFLRNGFRRYANLNTENADRIEIVKGPASVFFGQSAPGGVVNIISRKPSMQPEALFNFKYGSYDFKKVTVDVTGPLGRSLAYRVYASWLDSDDWRDFSYNQQTTFNPAVSWQPTSSLTFSLEYEYVDTNRNWVPYTLIGNKTYLADYANPSAAFQQKLGLTPAQIQARWRTNINQWITDTLALTGVQPFRITDYIPQVASRGLEFNTGGADQYIERVSHNTTLEANFRANDWLTLRYGGNYGEEYNRDLRSALTLGNGDGTVNLNATATRNSSFAWIHQLDALFKFELGPVANKLVLGGQYTDTHTVARTIALNTAASPSGANFYRFYDARVAAPIHLAEIPQILNPIAAGGDQVNPTSSLSLSWFGEWFESKRLTTLAGVRREQDVRERNGLDTLDRVATTPTYGFTFRLAEGFSAFASYSENFAPNGFRTITGGGVLPSDNAQDLPVELGTGWDIGLKADSKAHNLSGSLTVFQVERSNIPRSDFNADINDPRNANGLTQPGSVRYMTSGGLERTQGSELDLVWSPGRNYQALVAATWMWEAKVVRDPAINPASIDYIRQFQQGRRLRNAPEYMFSFWNKYTFTTGDLAGFSVGGGIKYVSEVDPRSTDLTSLMVNPAFTTVDLMVSYKAKFAGRPTTFSLNAQNLFDEVYFEGNTGASDPRKIFFNVCVGF
jgi:outer membrane receptor protein involved in Fe transport